MEYSPQGAIPYVARVDAGTIESIRERGVDVVSSGDLVQRFEACWDADAIATHRDASERLYRVKDRAFAAIAERLRAGTPTTEHDIQQLMAGWIRDEGMLSDSEPVVAVGAHAGRSALSTRPGGQLHHRTGRAGPAGPLGEAREAGRGVCRHHVGVLHGLARA